MRRRSTCDTQHDDESLQFENYLQGKSQEGNEGLLSLVRTLGSALVYAEPTNVETNRKLWDAYSEEWGTDEVWVKRIAGDDIATLESLGDEWAMKKDLDEVIKEYIEPYVDADSIVGEIGTGGGRIAMKVCQHGIGEFHCFDISSKMLGRAKLALSDYDNVHYYLLEEARLPNNLQSRFDFVYSFDVFVHLDLHTMWKYFKQIAIVLKPGAKAFVSTANLMTPGGWERFQKQPKYSVGGFYFVCPQIVNELIARSGLRIVDVGQPRSSNMYLNRDYLVVLEKDMVIL